MNLTAIVLGVVLAAVGLTFAVACALHLGHEWLSTWDPDNDGFSEEDEQ